MVLLTHNSSSMTMSHTKISSSLWACSLSLPFNMLKTSFLHILCVKSFYNFITSFAILIYTNMLPFIVNVNASLHKYNDKIVWRDGWGLLHAKKLEVLCWTFELWANENRSDTRVSRWRSICGHDEIMYYHTTHKGSEATKMALHSSDTFERGYNQHNGIVGDTFH